MKRASDAGTTAPASHVARLVPWNVILPSRDQVKSWISPADIAVHNSYVPVDVLRSFSKLITTSSTLLTKGVSSDLIMEAVAEALAEAEGSSQYLVNKERQLTHFLRNNLLRKLPVPLIITDTSTFVDRLSKRLCLYDKSKPDLCIFSNESTGLLITEDVNYVDGLTIEGKNVKWQHGNALPT